MDLSDIVEQPPETAPVEQVPKKPYWQVLDEYKKAQVTSPEIKGMSLPEFSAKSNEVLGTNEYDEGLNDSTLRRAGVGITTALHHFGGAGPEYPKALPSASEVFGGPREGVDLPALAGRAGETLARGVGAPEWAVQAAKTGAEALPETAVTVGTGLLAGAATGGVATIPTIAGLSGLGTYGETGRVLPAAISAGTAAVLPKVMEESGQAILGKLGAKTVGELRPDLIATLPKGSKIAEEIGSQFSPSGLVQRTARLGAAQTGMLGVTKASEAAQIAVEPDMSWQDKLAQVGQAFSPTGLVSSAIQQLPFTAMDVFAERTHPLARLERAVKSSFDQRFINSYSSVREEVTGEKTPPSDEEVQTAWNQARGATPAKPGTTTSEVLQSMGQLPVGIEKDTRPVKATDGEMQVMDAINTTTQRANDKLIAQGFAGDVGSAHLQAVHEYIRAAELQGGTKDDITNRAANAISDRWLGDKKDLAAFDTVNAPKDDPTAKQQALNQEVAKALGAPEIDPNAPVEETPMTIKVDTTSPTYDQGAHQMIALATGNTDDRVQAGLKDAAGNPLEIPLGLQGGGVRPLTDSIVNDMLGRRSTAEELKRVGAEIESLQQQLLDAQSQGTLPGFEEAVDPNFSNPQVDRIRAELEVRTKQYDEAFKRAQGFGLLNVAGQSTVPSANATAAAVEAAFNYGKEGKTKGKTLNVNDPKSVADFYKSVVGAIKQAELEWLRRGIYGPGQTARGKETFVEDPVTRGVFKPASKEEALVRAEELNNSSDKPTNVDYRVARTPEEDGLWRVVKTEYPETRSLDAEDAGVMEKVKELGEVSEEERLAQAAEEETIEGIDPELQRQAGIDPTEVALEPISEQIFAFRQLSDPAAALGRTAALTQNVVDYVKGLATSEVENIIKTGSDVERIQQAQVMKQRWLRLIQFMRDGGDIRMPVTKRGDNIKVKGVGDLEGLNRYLQVGDEDRPDRGKLAYTDFNKLNQPRGGGLNLFEQFYWLSQKIRQERPDPRIYGQERWLETRPRGSWQFLPPGFVDDYMAKLTVDWPTEMRAPLAANMAGFPTIHSIEEPGVLKVIDGAGKQRRYEVPFNPLMTLFNKGIKDQLLVPAHELVNMIKQFGGGELLAGDEKVQYDKMMDMATKLVQQFPFVRNQMVGFGVTKDPYTHGLFQTDKTTGSEGILLNPTIPDPAGVKFARLMRPTEVFPHLLEELAHSGVDFAYKTDKVFAAEVDKIFKAVTDYQKFMISMTGGPGVSVYDNMHSLSRPEELLAGMFKDGNLHKLLKGMKDFLGDLPWGAPATGSLWDRLIQMFRNLFEKIWSPEDAGTMLDRMSKTASRALDIQSMMNLENRKGIYQEPVVAERLLPQRPTRIETGVKKPVPKPAPGQESAYPYSLGQPRPFTPLEHLRDNESLLADAQSKLEYYKALATPRMGVTTVEGQQLVTGAIPTNLLDEHIRNTEAFIAKQEQEVAKWRAAVGEPGPTIVRPYEKFIQTVGQVGVEEARTRRAKKDLAAIQRIKGGGEVLQSRSNYRDELPEEKYTGPTQPVKSGTYHIEGKNFFLGDAPTQGYGTALKLKDGRLLSTFNRSFHGELVTVLDHLKISDQDIVDAGYVQDGKFRSGGDLAENLEPAKQEMATETDPEFWWRSKVGALERDEKRLRGGGEVLQSRQQVESSPEFRKWFAGSKVVDESGKPLVVYHGSQNRFEKFSKAALGSATNATSAKEGFFFAKDRDVASGYASQEVKQIGQIQRIVTNFEKTLEARGIKPDEYMYHGNFEKAGAKTERDRRDLMRWENLAHHADELTWGDTGWGMSEPIVARKGKVFDVYLNLKNPLKADLGGRSALNRLTETIKYAKAHGHDGVIFYDADDAATSNTPGVTDLYVAFEPNQIKSVENKGTFGPSENIYESRVPPGKVYDSMNSAATHTAAEQDNLWFKPYDLDYFRNTYAPAFGSKLKLEERGGQWGYSVNQRDLGQLTDMDVNRMPAPQLKPALPSAFETLKSLFRADGSSIETAEAQASWNLQFAALLKNTEGVIWGIIPEQGSLAGMAWGYSKIAGLAPHAIRRGTADETVRHEMTHTAGFNSAVESEPPDVKAAFKVVNDEFARLSPADRTIYLEGLSRLTEQEGYYRNAYSAAVERPDEFGAEFMGHVGANLDNVPNPSVYLRDVMRFAPDNLANLVKVTALRRAQALGRLDTYVEDQAWRQGTKTSFVQTTNKLLHTFNSLARSALDIAVDQAEFYRTRGLYPDLYKQYLSTLHDNLFEWGARQMQVDPDPTPSLAYSEVLQSREGPVKDYIREFFRLPTADGRLPNKLSLWDRTMTQFSQFALKYPVTRSFADMFNVSRGMTREAQQKLSTAMAGTYDVKNRLISDARTKDVATFEATPRLREAWSKVALMMNKLLDTRYDAELAKGGGDVFTVDPQKVTGWLTPEWVNGALTKNGITDPNDVRVLQTVFEGTRNQIAIAGSFIIRGQIHNYESLMAKALATHSNINPEPARELAQKLSQAIQLGPNDPNAMKMLGEVSTEVNNPKLFGIMYDIADKSWQDVLQLERFLALRQPAYSTERRPGKFGLFWEDAKGRITSRYFESAIERNKYTLANDIKPTRVTDPSSDQNWGVSPALFEQMDNIHKRMIERFTGIFGEEQANELGAALDMSTNLRDELNSRDMLKLTTHRTLAPGREELDMWDTHRHYLNSLTNALKNRFIKNEANLLFAAPEFDMQPQIKKQIQSQIQTMMAPDSPTGTHLQQLGFLYYLFANPSSMIMQLSHQVMGLAPMLTRMGQSVAGSYGTIAKANALVMEARRRGGVFKDPEIDALVKRREREGGIQSWLSREIDHAGDLAIVNRMRVTEGRGMMQPFDLLKNRVYQGYRLMRQLYDVIPTYNSKVAFVAAVLHLRSGKNITGAVSGEKLYKDASFMQSNTMYPGGKENRPGFFQYIPRGAAQAMWSLQTYANGLTTEMGELIRKSVYTGGMTPAQTRQVRKAAAQMLIAQTAVAGVLGLPFAGLMLTVLGKIFPEHDVEGSVRETLQSLGGDDDATGNAISTTLMTGVPSAMSYAPDVGSRFALHGVFHVSPNSNVGWQELMGASGGIFQNMFDAGQAGLRGEPMQGVQKLMPNGFRRIWKSLEQGNTYTTESGKMLADDLRPEEIVARAIGFTPSRIARIHEFEDLSKRAEAAEKLEQTNWTKKQVKLMRAGDDSTVQQNIAARVADSKGAYPAPQLANDVAREYERQTMPEDMRKYGNRATVLAQKSLRGALGTQTETPGSLERLQLQAQIAQRLGLGGPTGGAYRHAAGVDQLTTLYPNLTHAQANLLLTHAAASRPSPDLYQELLASGE